LSAVIERWRSHDNQRIIASSISGMPAKAKGERGHGALAIVLDTPRPAI